MSWPPTGTLYVNDRDMSVFKMAVATPRGFLSAPGIMGPSTGIPGRAGQARAVGERQIAPRRFTVEGVILGATTADADTLWGQAKRLLAEEELEVWFGWWPDRLAYCHFEGVEWIEVPGFTHGASFRFTFVMDDPYKYSRLLDVYVISDGTEAALLLGDAPSDVHLDIIGVSKANPTVYYKDAQGLERGDVGYDTPELIAGQLITYDGTWQLSTRTYVDDGIFYQDQPRLVSSHLFVADPDDGDETTGPVIEAVNCNAVAYCRKAWR